MNHNKPILLPTAYFPPVEYFVHIIHAPAIFIEQEETYTKQTYRNRCYIYGSNGALPLTVPVRKVYGNRTKTKDIEIVYQDEDWQKNHLRAIESAYNASPFLLFYRDEIMRFFEMPYENLLKLNTDILFTLLEALEIDVKPQFTEHFEKVPENMLDLRAEISPKLNTAQKKINIRFPHYTQVFEPTHGFLSNLSILDLLFNLGPEAVAYLKKCQPF
ncbi:MAG: WbqC family protein [Bacteroidales bacterium]|nr:WbqC family protein [Bacteroidales bacterium]